MDETTFRQVLQTVLEEFPPDHWSADMDSFEVLVAIIISQNTSVANERQALRGLRNSVGISAEAVARADVGDLEEALRPAGLHRMKAPRIKEVAMRILTEYDGDPTEVLRLPLEEARAVLMDFPGVGPKTADVFLNMVGGFPTFPVDTHIWRIARRWELTPGRNYEDVRSVLEGLVPPEGRRAAHLSLIKLGRTTCHARKPECPVCPVRSLCPYYAKLLQNE